MKTVLNLVLLLVWLSAYLGIVYVAGHYRRMRIGAVGVAGRGQFRAEKDMGVWFVTLVTGVMLGVAAFLVVKALGTLP